MSSDPRVPQSRRSHPAWRRSGINLANRRLWISSMLGLLVALCGVFGGLISTNRAYAASGLPYNAGGQSESPPLQFYAAASNYPAFVQHHPKVYLVFWGPEWNNDPDGVIPRVNATFKALAGSQYNNTLTQYADSSDHIYNDVSLAASVIDTSTPPSNLDIGIETNVGIFWNGQIRNEADKAIAANHWAVNQDSQVIVFPQKGSTYAYGSTFCGVHAFDSTASSPYAYAEIQYGDQSSCDFVGDPAEDIAWTAVHEYAEAATDPVIQGSPNLNIPPYTALGSGWHTKDSSKTTPQEVADLCSGYSGSPTANDYYDPSTGTSYTLPLLWSNADNGCVSGRGQTFRSPVSPGRHTVQFGILGEYTSYNSYLGTYVSQTLGEPVTEEVPVTGGSASYFAGPGGTYCPGNAPYGSCTAIYWSSSTGAHYLRLVNYWEYQYLRGTGWTGFPSSDELPFGNGSVQYFLGGTACESGCAIYSSAATSSNMVNGAIYSEDQYLIHNEGWRGFPENDAQTIPGGVIQYFSYGGSACSGNSSCAIIWSSSTGAHMVWGAVYNEYQYMTGIGWQGFPTTDEEAIPGGVIQYFANGSTTCHSCAIIWSSSTGANTVGGAIYDEYQQLVTTTSWQGFPSTEEQAITGGSVQYFSNGGSTCNGTSACAIYWSSSTGAHMVWGGIYQAYLNAGGPEGVLGFPTDDEWVNSAGYAESDFQNGSLDWENGQAVIFTGSH